MVTSIDLSRIKSVQYEPKASTRINPVQVEHEIIYITYPTKPLHLKIHDYRIRFRYEGFKLNKSEEKFV